MSKTYVRLENTVEVGTGGVPVRAIIENPTNEVSLTHRCSSEGFLVRFTLVRPGENQRSTILKHRGEISAVYAQTIGWTLTV